MGKYQDEEKPVKREVVSASANLIEVISQESFDKRLKGMSSTCVNCNRERDHTQRIKPNRKRQGAKRKQHSKSNSPAVVHLKDTLKSGNSFQQSSFENDMEWNYSAAAAMEQYFLAHANPGMYGSIFHTPQPFQYIANRGLPSFYFDVASIPEFVPNGYHYNHQAFPQLHPQNQHRSPVTSLVQSEDAQEKSRKNLTALISVIEKAHSKEPKDLELNLANNRKSIKSCNTLNNISPSSLKEEFTKRRNMSECANVDLICNDLSTTAEKINESTDDSDSSDKASETSSSDTQSDDVADLPSTYEMREKKFSRQELEQLAEYTSGVPLIKYEVPRSQCHECMRTLNSYQGFSCNRYPIEPRHLTHAHHSHHSQGGQKMPCGKAATAPTTAGMSSDSDLSSDFEDAYTSHQAKPSHYPSSSLSSSSLPRASVLSVGKTVATSVVSASGSKSLKVSYTQEQCGENSVVSNCHNANVATKPCTSNKKPKQQTEPKRARASWKSAKQLWDIDVSKASKRNVHGLDPFVDSVYMDLTGLDVTISVVYHNTPQPPPPPAYHYHTLSSSSTSTWPYPVHSLYQAVYTPPVHSGFNFSSKFNFPLYYPLKTDITPPPEWMKYDMSLSPNRPWITSGSPEKDVPSAIFSVMCYNVLCDKLCTKSMYAYCPTWALNWDYRKKGIMSDIIRGNGDIITLQEVETEQYYSMFYPELAQLGYDGIFMPKSRVRTMNSEKEKKCVDGCAIFFKKHKFEKVNEYQVEFSQLATKDGASNTDTDMINRVSTKDNIAIVAALRTKPAVYENSPVPAPKGFTQMLMVSTAHIHWDPQLPDVKLVQTIMLIEELQKFVKEASMQFRPNAPPPSLDTDPCNSVPLILCGDFNSLPDSGVYEYLSKGRLDISHKDFEGQCYKEFMKDRTDKNIISHNFKMTSAYKEIIPFTNYTYDFKGIIDYIFFSDKHLRLHCVMGLQDEEWFKANKIVGCPHPFVPSDHFPLFAEFSLPALNLPHHR